MSNKGYDYFNMYYYRSNGAMTNYDETKKKRPPCGGPGDQS